ncbi:unnamed protein product [Anisakis simplex]|uniref:Transposase n=1 Tax=Anisakis simplex TaxID=6269 RepID=A0A0M3K233_ANISI|nr:unnamed protein product [Anisakis simplex]
MPQAVLQVEIDVQLPKDGLRRFVKQFKNLIFLMWNKLCVYDYFVRYSSIVSKFSLCSAIIAVFTCSE